MPCSPGGDTHRRGRSWTGSHHPPRQCPPPVGPDSCLPPVIPDAAALVPAPSPLFQQAAGRPYDWFLGESQVVLPHILDISTTCWATWPPLQYPPVSQLPLAATPQTTRTSAVSPGRGTPPPPPRPPVAGLFSSLHTLPAFPLRPRWRTLCDTKPRCGPPSKGSARAPWVVPLALVVAPAALLAHRRGLETRRPALMDPLVDPVPLWRRARSCCSSSNCDAQAAQDGVRLPTAHSGAVWRLASRGRLLPLSFPPEGPPVPQNGRPPVCSPSPLATAALQQGWFAM